MGKPHSNLGIPRLTHRLTHRAHQRWAQVVRPGDTLLDLTCGRGNDALVMAGLLGNAGRLVCVDVQIDAIESTRAVLRDHEMEGVGVEYVCDDHAAWLRETFSGRDDAIGDRVSLAAFNLGWLPGSDKTVITRPESTIDALNSLTGANGSQPIVRKGGLVSVMCYTGHPGGSEEHHAVSSFAKGSLSLHDGTTRRRHPS